MYSIETDNLTKKYKNKTVVDNLNLKIKKNNNTFPYVEEYCFFIYV